MYKIKIDDFKIFIENGATIHDGNLPIDVLNISSVEDANENSLIFIDSKAKNKKSIVELTKANFIICDEPTYKEYNGPKKCFIVNNNPKLCFAKCINSLIKLNNKPIIHDSVVISQNAKIHPSVSIGANCYIGNCQIEEGTIIHPNCSIYDNVIIGKNVIIDSGAVIGSAGFGFVRDKDGIPHQFPQLGGVIIEDNVEIGANTCIDRGSLNNTVIHKGVKIDNLVQIAHNVVIGEYTYIIASTIIAGSVTIGSHCWIATSNILNKVKIGNNVTVGFGANVLKSVKDNTTIMGDPAVEVEKYSKLQYNLKNL